MDRGRRAEGQGRAGQLVGGRTCRQVGCRTHVLLRGGFDFRSPRCEIAPVVPGTMKQAHGTWRMLLSETISPSTILLLNVTTGLSVIQTCLKMLYWSKLMYAYEEVRSCVPAVALILLRHVLHQRKSHGA